MELDEEPFVLTPTPMPSKFRIFCNQMWYEHRDEIFAWTGNASLDYDQNYYLKKHKWLLKRLYKDSKIG